MTRRELRELRNVAAQEEARVGAPEPDAPPTVTPPVVPPATPEATTVTAPASASTAAAQGEEVAAAMARFDSMLHKEQESAPLVEPPANLPTAAGQPFDSAAPPSPVVFPESATPQMPVVSSTPVAPVAPVAYPHPVTLHAPVVPSDQTAAPEPVALQGSTAYPVPEVSPNPAAPDDGAAEPLREVVTAPEVYSAPSGHWSTQAAMDESFESVGAAPHTRDLSASDAITTSALVMPSFPVSSPTTGPVSGTGETLVTGSINLPRSLGVTGLHPSRYDRADIDDIIDAADREDASPNSAPVRAVRAVSTYTSSHGIINAKPPKGNNLPMVLSITAGVMMVGVVVLVVVGMIFKIF